MGAEKIPPTQAEALARRIRDALGPFNDPNEPVQSLVEKLAERALSAAPPSESAPAEGVGEVELLAIRVEATARHIRACPVYDKLRGDADDMDAAAALIRQQASAYDALAAERDRLLEHANSLYEQVKGRRESLTATEAARDAAVEAFRWLADVYRGQRAMPDAEADARIDTLLTEALREG